MLIGLISDSHDHLPHIKQAVQVFRQHNVDKVLHAGDYCSPFTIEPFEGLGLTGVLGKNDGDISLLREKFEDVSGSLHDHFTEILGEGCKIALYNGIEPAVTSALAKCGTYDVVVTGHTHSRKNQQINNTLSVNPGTAHGFGKEATVALLNTNNLKVDFITLYK